MEKAGRSGRWIVLSLLLALPLIAAACAAEEATPTPRPQPTPTSTPAPLPTETATSTPILEPTATPTPTGAPQPTATPTPPPSPTPTPTPTALPSPTATSTPTVQRGEIFGVMSGIAFRPPQFLIGVGSTITFTNQDGVPHTFTSDPGQAISFDSPFVNQGESISIIFNTAGTFTFFCRVHPTIMNNGVITVVAEESDTGGTYGY